MTAGALALWIGAAFALLAVWAGLTGRPADPRATIATRALGMAAAFTTLALGLLADALRRSDLSVDYVVRHTTLALPLAARLLAITADPAGAGLLAAVALLAIGTWVVRRGEAPAFAAAVGAVALVVLAAPLAGRPHAILPWLPVDGQDPVPLLRQPMAVAWVLGMVGSLVAATLVLGNALAQWRGEARLLAGEASARVTLVLVAVQAMAHLQASLASGLSRDLSPVVARGGTGTAAFVAACVALVVVRSPVASAQGRAESALGAVLATLALVLAPASALPGIAVQGLALLALAISCLGAWRSREAFGGLVAEGTAAFAARRAAWVLPGLASLVALVALAAGLGATEREVALPSGGQVQVGSRASLDHLGISRYDAGDAVVLALAIEARRGGGVSLGSAEHREYTDARGSVLGGLWRTPAVLPGLVTIVAWMDRVGDDDGATLSVARRPDWLAWWLALALLAAHVVAMLAQPARSR